MLVKTGIVNESAFKRSNNHLNTKGLNILTTTNVNSSIHQFAIYFYSNRSARSIFKIFSTKAIELLAQKVTFFCVAIAEMTQFIAATGRMFCMEAKTKIISLMNQS